VLSRLVGAWTSEVNWNGVRDVQPISWMEGRPSGFLPCRPKTVNRRTLGTVTTFTWYVAGKSVAAKRARVY
jgi:hypothetical protein